MRKLRFAPLKPLLVAVGVWALSLTASAQNQNQTTQVYFVVGSNLTDRIEARIPQLLGKVPNIRVSVVKDASALKPEAGSIVLALGDSAITRTLISKDEVKKLGSEGFVVRSKVNADGALIIATDGNAASGERTSMKTNRGVSFGAYEVLQQVGFRFFHPFSPLAPQSLSRPTDLAVNEKPRWPTRGLHWHTMHPIELANVLNGWGPKGPNDAAGFNSLLNEWDLFGEWMIAHRQNTVEWVLLADKTFTAFNDSDERIRRLEKLVDMSHAWGLITGIDVGIVFEQQNMYRLLRNPTTDAADSNEIRSRIRYLMKADWDFMTAEMGASEFTAPSATKMLYWMNVVTDEMERVYNRFSAVKIHVSEGQAAKGFNDPDTGKGLNFNFLPHYADKKLMVLPHTVELYSLDDPAPTYGNKDFKEMRRFLSMEAGSRPVVWYPEGAYYVSYDIDMPLFLPSYGERRLHDLRLIAGDEEKRALGRGTKKGSRIQGQLLFASGFEWGYWYNYAVAMHAAWDPELDTKDEAKALEKITLDILRPDAASRANALKLASLLTETNKVQNELLIQGRVNGKAPRQIERLTGIAYMAGQETWDELNTSLADVLKMRQAPTQPTRLGFRSLRSSIVGQGVDFVKEVHPLLEAMELQFNSLSSKMIALLGQMPKGDTSRTALAEFADGAFMNTLRATQIHALYDAAGSNNLKQNWESSKIERARHAVDLAARTVERREASYKARKDLSEWGVNPTVYNYGYLWTVHNLFYWYRDEGNIVKRPKNACYMNIINPAKVAFANGEQNSIYKWAQVLAKVIGFGSLDECVKPAMTERNPRERVRSNGFAEDSELEP